MSLLNLFCIFVMFSKQKLIILGSNNSFNSCFKTSCNNVCLDLFKNHFKKYSILLESHLCLQLIGVIKLNIFTLFNFFLI